MLKSRIFAILTLVVAAIFAAGAQDMSKMIITAKTDSLVLVQGDRVAVRVEVVKNGHNGALLNMPEKEADYHGLEMADCAIDSTDLGNGRVQVDYDFTFQAFDPNEALALPPFEYVVGADTLKSNVLTFKVLPVELDPELGDPAQPDSLKIHPDEPIMSVHSKWYDYIPDWIVWVIAGILVAAVLVVLWLLYRKNGPAIFTPRKPVPPYERAMDALAKLRDKQLIEKGLGKEFYTEATDIWRTYLNGRFGIQAMEMTSGQIIKELRGNNETRLTADQMERILQISDFVKFAALNPTPEEMRQAFNSIYNFVETTRPVPQPEGEDKEGEQSVPASEKASGEPNHDPTNPNKK